LFRGVFIEENFLRGYNKPDLSGLRSVKAGQKRKEKRFEEVCLVGGLRTNIGKKEAVPNGTASFFSGTES